MTRKLVSKVPDATRVASTVRKLVPNPPGSEQMHHIVEKHSCFLHGDHEGDACPKCRDDGAQLAKELDRSSSPVDWEESNKRAERPFDPELGRIVETVVRVEDPHETWKRLEAALRLGERRTQPGEVARALDDAETNARLSHRLWMMALVEKERWERENAPLWAALVYEANKVLQKEKDDKLRNKAITDADVDAMISTLHPDEHAAQKTKRARVEAFVKSMQHLCECWTSRCYGLKSLHEKQR